MFHPPVEAFRLCFLRKRGLQNSSGGTGTVSCFRRKPKRNASTGGWNIPARCYTMPTMSETVSAPSVSYSTRTFLIDGKPEIFLSACIHYFRVPHELWSDRIAKAKRGGMNTIETYVAWNFHEPEQGKWNWSGDADLGEFLSECERQGMYVIVRPGPYICAEWDFGGFPVFLINIPGLETRRMNAPYLAAMDAYFDAVTPIIAAHQWTNGGGVILVQVENEYENLKWTRGKDMLVDDEYQHYVRDGLLRRGITVPLLSCAGYCSGTVEGVNSHNPGDLMPKHRETHPEKPIFSTEFWTAWYDAWGQPHHTRSAADIAYASLRCFAEGACGYNYYVYHGGTNFGYTPMYIQTTSYDYDAQISETGRLTEKWRASKRVALWAKTWKHILLHGENKRGLKGSDGLRVSETATKQNGGIVFVDNPDKENAVTGHVAPYLPEVRLRPRELFPYVHDAPIGDPVEGGNYLASYVGLVKSDAPVLTAHIRPHPFEGARVYVYGDPGETKEVVLFHGAERGQALEVAFTDAPLVYPVGPSQIVALPAELAGRTFFVENAENAPVIIGPDDVREHGDDFATVEVAPGKTHTLFSILPSGAITEINIVAPDLPAPPTLGPWESRAEPDYTAPDFDDSGWTEISEPTSMIALGNGNNPYGWYRAEVESPVTASGRIHFAACTDRLILYVNGARVGASDIPPEDNHAGIAHTATFDVELTEGRNVLTVLADNLGLIKGDWQIGKGQENEKKGIYGPVTLNVPGACWMIDISKWRFRGTLHGEREGWMSDGESGQWSVASDLDSAPIRWHRSTFTLDAAVDTATPLMVRLDGMGKGVLWLNGRNLGRYWQPVGPQEVYYAPEPWLRVGENMLVLAETEGNTPEQVRLEWDANSAAVMTIAL